MNTRGFAMVTVLFAMVVMSIVAVVAVTSALNEQGASYAVRRSGVAMAAADYGVKKTANEWRGFDSLASGQAVAIASDTITGMPGVTYTVIVHRIDADTTGTLARTFAITAIGLDASGAERGITLVVTNTTELLGGLATSSAATTRGTVDVHTGATISGFDDNPPEWGATCGLAGSDRPGLTMNDTLQLDTGGGTNEGNPPTEQMALNDSLMSYFGVTEWDDLRAMAHDTVVGAAPRDLTGCPTIIADAGMCGPNEIGPRYNGDGTCDTTAALNWGSNDPTDVCFGFFPILLIQQEIDVNDCEHCNGIFVLDSDIDSLGNRGGAELDVERDVVMRGLIFGRGCVEFQERADFRGSVFVDGTYDFGECNTDATLDVHDAGTRVSYSRCAIERALLANGLGLPTLVFDRVQPISSRAWSEPVR